MNPLLTLGPRLRVVAGLALVAHGLAHAVFALRGTAGWQATYAGAHAVLIVYTVALVLFVAAGVGTMGSRFLYPARIPLMTGATAASIAALALGWQRDLWVGLAADVIIAAWLMRRRAPEPIPPRDERRFLARTSEGLAVVFVAYVTLGAVLWPWHRTWGTVAADWQLALPGDPPVRHQATELMHGIAIDAPDWVVWAWLVQIGQDRAGFYSYDGLERLFGVDIRNADELRNEWQPRAPGDRVPATQPGYLGGIFGDRPGWQVGEVRPCRALVLDTWGTFAVVPDGPHRSRLLVRSRIGGPDAPVAGAALSFLAFELPHFIMERGMLRGIKRRAESPRGQIGASPCAAVL